MAKKKITNRSGKKKKHKNSIREIKESISNSRWFLEKNPICSQKKHKNTVFKVILLVVRVAVFDVGEGEAFPLTCILKSLFVAL